MDKLKFIKIVVFALTFLLVFGTLVLMGAIFKQVNPKKQIYNPEVFLQEPQGSSIEALVPDKDRVYLLVKNGGLEDRVLVLEKSSNKLIAKIKMQ